MCCFLNEKCSGRNGSPRFVISESMVPFWARAACGSGGRSNLKILKTYFAEARIHEAGGRTTSFMRSLRGALVFTSPSRIGCLQSLLRLLKYAGWPLKAGNVFGDFLKNKWQTGNPLKIFPNLQD